VPLPRCRFFDPAQAYPTMAKKSDVEILWAMVGRLDQRLGDVESELAALRAERDRVNEDLRSVVEGVANAEIDRRIKKEKTERGHERMNRERREANMEALSSLGIDDEESARFKAPKEPERGAKIKLDKALTLALPDRWPTGGAGEADKLPSTKKAGRRARYTSYLIASGGPVLRAPEGVRESEWRSVFYSDEWSELWLEDLGERRKMAEAMMQRWDEEGVEWHPSFREGYWYWWRKYRGEIPEIPPERRKWWQVVKGKI
jgi:hypothetical protein